MKYAVGIMTAIQWPGYFSRPEPAHTAASAASWGAHSSSVGIGESGIDCADDIATSIGFLMRRYERATQSFPALFMAL